jgi:hypothetical protein
MRLVIVAGLLVGSAFAHVAIAEGEALPTSPPESVVSTTSTAEPVSPISTSELGTKTEIEISIDDHGNIVPG